ncbi:MAG: M14 family metallopeptidase [Gemmatimonadaceae bacterium]
MTTRFFPDIGHRSSASGYRRSAIRVILTLFLAVVGCAPRGVRTSVRGIAGPQTRAERTAYKETSHYADVIAFIDSLRGRKELAFGVIGKTTEGRDIPYVIASRPLVSTPEQARALRRPIVYVQGNIHAGEVEGKEALLALLRDLTNSSEPNVLDSLVLIAVPIYNADGNEKFAPQEVNRGAQNGPESVGVRANAQGLDLNRDYVKAEAPETRASLGMFDAWDPDVFVDLHTTDGSYHGYALTYAPPLNPAARYGGFTRDVLLPAVVARMRAAGFATFDYGDFISDDTLSKGWVTFDSRPRFGTNYYGLRGRIAILSEAYSHDTFPRRVASTYQFVQSILSFVAANGGNIRRLSDLFTRTSMLWRNTPGVTVPIRSQLVAPDTVPVVAEILEHTRDSTRTQPGVPKGLRRTGKFRSVRMPVFVRFNPTLEVAPPVAYTISPSDTQVVRVLQLHGIVVDSLTVPVRAQAQTFVTDSTNVSPRPFQGHNEMQLVGHWVTESRDIPRGTYIVRTAQPQGVLVVYLLEPQSDDGLVTWNFFDRELRPGANYPVMRLMTDPRPASR